MCRRISLRHSIMKTIVAVLTTAHVLVRVDAAVVKATSILSRSRNSTEPIEQAAPRKLSLFVRTQAVQKDEAHQPLFGALGGPTPIAASTLAGTGISQPTQQDLLRAGALVGGECHPKCWWSCGNADCDEVCDPVCAPPQCETACSPITMATCRQKCEPPKCAIVCPGPCAHGGCPNCKTICAPPKCTTQCAEQCESKCSDPQCTWKCNPGQCEKPRCSLQCGGAKVCGLDGNLNARPPPFTPGMTVLSKGLAATDPSALAALASTPMVASQAPLVVPMVAPQVGSPAPAPLLIR